MKLSVYLKKMNLIGKKAKEQSEQLEKERKKLRDDLGIVSVKFKFKPSIGRPDAVLIGLFDPKESSDISYIGEGIGPARVFVENVVILKEMRLKNG